MSFRPGKTEGTLMARMEGLKPGKREGRVMKKFLWILLPLSLTVSFVGLGRALGRYASCRRPIRHEITHL